MLPLNYEILHKLKEPKTLGELSNGFRDLTSMQLKPFVESLIGQSKVKIVDYVPDGQGNYINVYESINKITYKTCVKCNDGEDVENMNEGLCLSCYLEEGERIYPTSTPSSITIQHAQSIITEQKKLIYQLKMENYLLKKGML